ncbi:MAG: CDP-alcohol phosphatidyltransferase family protein [Muribaculaceae bacterium]|nr:CDP-alcohol phosphatidyltransferase family protein [Muribaculaceae bacterium]
MDSKESFIEKYKATLKSMDTEEPIDLMFYRPIGYAWALLCEKLGITPNVITIASIFLGVGAGIMFYFDNMVYNIIGMFLLIWANSFDSADGQLARMTKQYSRLGRILDGLSGDLWFVTIYFAICFREIATSGFFIEHHWVIWVLAVTTGLCHAKQAAMADYYRQFHLFFLKGKEGSELESVQILDERYASLSWGHNFWQKIVLFFYRNYTANQEKLTPSMQNLRRTLKTKFGEEIPQTFRDAFRAKSKPLMKYTNWLSFNVRVCALFCALFAQMPWLYFAFEFTVLNIMLIYMMLRHEKICKNFVKELQNGTY